MPRAKLPDHFKTYEVVAEGHGPTLAFAVKNLNENIYYHKKWVRGECKSPEFIPPCESLSGGYKATAKLVFLDRNYFKDESIN